MSVETELVKINEQLAELALRINDDGALSMVTSPRDEATLRRLRIEAKSLLDQALGVANNFSLSLHFLPVGASLLGAIEESRAVVEGAVNHLRRGAVEAKRPTDGLTAHFVDVSRIAELKSAKSKDWDLTRLTRICEELNMAFSNNCFMSVAMLGRAIIDHVPPIFGKQNFSEVASQYGPRSFQQSMKNLQLSLRNIADMHLHLQIRRQEVLPTASQVDFHRDLDVLLGEVARVLKRNSG